MIFTIDFDYEDFFRIPTIDIGIDDQTLYQGNVNESITIDVDLADGDHTLWIKHYNKKLYETTNEHDHHVFIKRILFGDIDLDQIDYCKLTHRGKFYPEYESSYIISCRAQGITLPEYIQPNHYLGHNGIWKLDFSSPELLWIITQQNPGGMHLEDTMFSTGAVTLSEVKNFFNL